VPSHRRDPRTSQPHELTEAGLTSVPTTSVHLQDLWGKDVIHLMTAAKSQYDEGNFAGALEQYILARDGREQQGDIPPSPNILVNMANCYSKLLNWLLALHSAKRALGFLLQKEQHKAWAQEPSRLNLLRTRALSLQARAEEILGQEEDVRRTLVRAKQLGLLPRVRAQLREAALAAAALADCPGLTSKDAAGFRTRQNRRKRSNAKARKAGAKAHMSPELLSNPLEAGL
jgi:hypothetical protein